MNIPAEICELLVDALESHLICCMCVMRLWFGGLMGRKDGEEWEVVLSEKEPRGIELVPLKTGFCLPLNKSDAWRHELFWDVLMT